MNSFAELLKGSAGQPKEPEVEKLSPLDTLSKQTAKSAPKLQSLSESGGAYLLTLRFDSADEAISFFMKLGKPESTPADGQQAAAKPDVAEGDWSWTKGSSTKQDPKNYLERSDLKPEHAPVPAVGEPNCL